MGVLSSGLEQRISFNLGQLRDANKVKGFSDRKRGQGLPVL